jgi:hypothetical protein
MVDLGLRSRLRLPLRCCERGPQLCQKWRATCSAGLPCSDPLSLPMLLLGRSPERGSPERSDAELDSGPDVIHDPDGTRAMVQATPISAQVFVPHRGCPTAANCSDGAMCGRPTRTMMSTCQLHARNHAPRGSVRQRSRSRLSIPQATARPLPRPAGSMDSFMKYAPRRPKSRPRGVEGAGVVYIA